MSEIGSERAFLKTSPSKLCVEQNGPDSEVNVGDKRRKESWSTPAVMESENHEAQLEPVVMKRKRTSGDSLERELKEKTVPVELALNQSGNLSCKETEQVPSCSEEGCLNQILPEQKDRGTWSEMDFLRNDLVKKCRKRRVKLFRKQTAQFEKFHRFWEKKRSNLVRDHRKEKKMIHFIFGKSTPATNSKLNLLEGEFIKKMREHNRRKDVECEELKAEQLVARDEERQKEARWLAACGLPSEQLVVGDEETQKEAQKVGRDVSNTLSTDPQNEPDVAFLQNDQLKMFCPRQIVCALPASSESVLGEIVQVELNKEVPTKVPGTVSVETNEPSEQTNVSWTPHHCTSLLPQASEDQITCSSTSDTIQDIGAEVNSVPDQSGQVVENQNASPFEVAASVNVGTVTVVQPNVELHDQDAAVTSRGEVANLQSNDKLQDQDATDLADQTTLLTEVANSEPIDVVNPVQSSIGAPAVLNGDVFPSCNESPHIEVETESHNPERISSQTAEVTDSVVVSHESSSQLGENQVLPSNHIGIGSGSQLNLERNSSESAQTTDTLLLPPESTSQLGGNLVLQSNHFGIGSESQVINETCVEVSSSSGNSGSMSQILANTHELPHQAGLQLGTVGNLPGFVNPVSHHQVTSFSSPPLYAAAPLQQQVEKISKEIEQIQKSHDDMKSQLKSDYEKEVQELLAHLKSKYDLTLQEAEAEFSNKKNGLDQNRSKVFMNINLAETFSSSFRDLWWLQRNQQASTASSMQHSMRPPPMPTNPMQHLVRPPPMPMGHQSISGHPIRTPNIQQLLQSNPTIYTSITPSPQHAPDFTSISTSRPLRPLVINTITPTGIPGFRGNFRSGAPHLRPLEASFMSTPTFPSNVQNSQHVPPQSLQPPPPPPPPPSHPIQPSSTFLNRPQVQLEPPALLNPSLSAPVLNVDDRPNAPASSCLPQINSSVGSLEQSHLARLRNVQGNRTYSAAENAICISDDD